MYQRLRSGYCSAITGEPIRLWRVYSLSGQFSNLSAYHCFASLNAINQSALSHQNDPPALSFGFVP